MMDITKLMEKTSDTVPFVMQHKSKIYDTGLVVAGSIQAHKVSDIPNNILNSLIEQPIPSLVGMVTLVLVTLRVIRMLQKMFNGGKEGK